MISRLFSSEPVPRIPSDIEPSMEKYLRELHDYIRRLGGLMTGENLEESVAQEGGLAWDVVQHPLTLANHNAGPPAYWSFSEPWTKAVESKIVHLYAVILEENGAKVANRALTVPDGPAVCIKIDSGKVSVLHAEGGACMWEAGGVVSILIAYERN